MIQSDLDDGDWSAVLISLLLHMHNFILVVKHLLKGIGLQSLRTIKSQQITI